MTREGLEIASRLGSGSYGFVMSATPFRVPSAGGLGVGIALLDRMARQRDHGDFYLERSWIGRSHVAHGGDASADIARRTPPAG